jgi:hypothetical protein
MASTSSDPRPSGGAITTAYTDIEGSTGKLERLGDEQRMELIHWQD